MFSSSVSSYVIFYFSCGDKRRLLSWSVSAAYSCVLSPLDILLQPFALTQNVALSITCITMPIHAVMWFWMLRSKRILTGQSISKLSHSTDHNMEPMQIWYSHLSLPWAQNLLSQPGYDNCGTRLWIVSHPKRCPSYSHLISPRCMLKCHVSHSYSVQSLVLTITGPNDNDHIVTIGGLLSESLRHNAVTKPKRYFHQYHNEFSEGHHKHPR